MWSFVKKRLSPFSVANFRYFFFAQSFSLIGTWSHELARSWLVLSMAHTATALGTLLLCTALPGIFLTLHGGVIADRADTRRLLIYLKFILALSAFFLFFLVVKGEIKLWMIYAFALIEGFVNSFDGPALATVFARIMPRDHFQQALAIQSTSFHVSRMLGPAVAGIIMALKGPAYVFLFDAISYLGVIYIIHRMELRPFTPTESNGDAAPKGGALEGLKYFFKNAESRYKVLQFIFSVTILLPLMSLVFRTYLKQKFNLTGEQFGYLFSFPSMGAMLAALYFTFAALKQPHKNLIVSVPALILSLMWLEHAHTPFEAALLLGVSGFFSYLNIASLTQSLHIQTEDQYRGRLGALLTLFFASVSPLLGFPIGVLTDTIGYEPTIRYLTLLFALLSTGWAYMNIRRAKNYSRYRA